MADEYQGSEQNYGQDFQSGSEGGAFQNAASRAGQAFTSAVDTVKDQAQEGMEQIRSAAHSAREQGERAYGQVRDQVNHRPMTFVLTALATGVLIGALVTHMFEAGQNRY